MRMSREQYVLLGPAGLMQHCEKIEAENDRLTAYAEQFARHIASSGVGNQSGDPTRLMCIECGAKARNRPSLAHADDCIVGRARAMIATLSTETDADRAMLSRGEIPAHLAEPLAALAKNPTNTSEARHAPASSGEAGTRDEGTPSGGTEKPFGQALHSVFRAEAREVWTTITGNGPGLWKDYDLQSVATIEKALQRASSLSQGREA